MVQNCYLQKKKENKGQWSVKMRDTTWSHTITTFVKCPLSYFLNEFPPMIMNLYPQLENK